MMKEEKARTINTEGDDLPLLIEGDALLEEHTLHIKSSLKSLFREEIKGGKELVSKLPLVKWRECYKVPGAFPIALLCTHAQSQQIRLLFYEMVSHWLIPGQQLQILSSHNLSFRLRNIPDLSLYFAKLLVFIEKEKQLPMILRNLPFFSHDIRQAALSPRHAKHILDMKRLSLGGKTLDLYRSIFCLMRRFPKYLNNELIPDVQHFLIHTQEEFRTIRHVHHICGIICLQHLFRKWLQQESKVYPQKRHLHLKLMHPTLYYTFGIKKVVGIVIAFNSLSKSEWCEKRHLLNAVQRILPTAFIIKESYIATHPAEERMFIFYFELQKNDGNFSLSELKRLRKELPSELKNSIELLSPSLFIPRNEEEIVRNIITLSQELKYVRDLPQAIISFQEQRYDRLRFNVILLRIVKDQLPPLALLRRSLPEGVHFIPEKVANVGMLRKKYTKEANLFALEVETRLFLRKNNSVDLPRARSYIVQALEKLLGPFRDYNGGFLLKQKEQLDSIKKQLGPMVERYEFLIENLFYSITPSIMQTLISPQLGKAVGYLFIRLLQQDLLSEEDFILEIEKIGQDQVIAIKAGNYKLKEKLLHIVKELSLNSFKIAIASNEIDGLFYLTFIFLSPDPEETTSLKSALEGILNDWVQEQKNQQIVHIHLPRPVLSLDPRIGSDRTSGIVLKMLYEGLMRVKEKAQIEYAIAKDVKITPDWKRYTFFLRKSFWSNGTPLTAYDFEYSWKTMLEPDFRSPFCFLFFSIINAEAAKKGGKPLHSVGIKALDAHTLQVDLVHPAPHFLSLTAHWTYFPLCQEIEKHHPGWAYHHGTSYVCNGPFILEQFKPGDDLIVEKNPLYWDQESVKLQKISITIVENNTSVFKLFQQGRLDWYGDPMTKISLSHLPALKKNNQLQTEDIRGLFLLQLNTERPPLQSAKVRRALSLSIDRKKIIEEIIQSDDQPMEGFSIADRYPLQGGDLKKARELFEEGLKELKISREELAPLIFSHSEIGEQEAIAEEIGRQWKEVLGLEIKLERLLWNTFFDALTNQDYTIGGLIWYCRYDDPIYYLDLLVYREHSTSISQWKHPQFCHLIAQAKEELDPQKRRQLLQKAEAIAQEEMPFIPLFFEQMRYAKNHRLRDVVLSEIGQIDFRKAYLEPH